MPILSGRRGSSGSVEPHCANDYVSFWPWCGYQGTARAAGSIPAKDMGSGAFSEVRLLGRPVAAMRPATINARTSLF